jgi:hypothetical protein
MDYGNWRLETRARLTHALLRRYVVNADVAQCFPSIYTHAIAWATVGISNAKQSVGKNTWFNRLDQCVMMQKRNETSGILVGPGTSNIVVELILSPIDDEIRKNGFLFDRYIDDYSAYVDSLDRADEFISLLSQELFRYKLSLNDAKSMVKELPEALIERAIVELSNLCPKSDSVGFYEASRYLDFAVTVAKANPSVSALKYALKSLLARGISDNAISDFFLYFLMLAYRQPTLLPLLEMLPRRNLLIGIGAHEETLNRLLLVYAKSGKADAVVWAIYFLTMASLSIRNDSAKAILDSQDCLSLTLLYRFGSREQKDAVVTLAKSTVQQDLYIRDQYWVLLYEIYREKRIGNPYHRAPKDQAFKVMRDKGIHFIESQALGL